MALWYTYDIPKWEIELENLENELDLEHIVEEEYEKELDKYEMWLFDQKMDFYDDISKIGGAFTKFLYKIPSRFTEDTWCEPHFNCKDEMGLFYKLVDITTFNMLMTNFFSMKKSFYYPQGEQHYEYRTLKSLFSFAERWCKIHLLYDDQNNDFNYKLTLWVASRIMIYLV